MTKVKCKLPMCDITWEKKDYIFTKKWCRYSHADVYRCIQKRLLKGSLMSSKESQNKEFILIWNGIYKILKKEGKL